MTSLHIRNLVVENGNFRLGPVSLDVEPGEIVGIVGTNGAGKTTLLKAAFGALPATSGDVALFGTDVALDTIKLRDAKRRLAYVADAYSLPDRPVKSLDRLGSMLYPDWDGDDFYERYRAAGIYGEDYDSDLSKGQSMWLSIAFALAHKPELVLLDEPDAGLDVLKRRELVSILRDYVAETGASVVISSHIINDVEAVADRVIALRRGKVLFETSTERVCDQHGIATLTTEQWSRLAAEGVLGPDDPVLTHPYSIEALVDDRAGFAALYPQIPVAPCTLEKYMLFKLEGQSNEG